MTLPETTLPSAVTPHCTPAGTTSKPALRFAVAPAEVLLPGPFYGTHVLLLLIVLLMKLPAVRMCLTVLVPGRADTGAGL